VRLILQNKGKLAQGKRRLFPEITDDEITTIESVVRSSSGWEDSA
jgi:hypothetical protein